ncbi:hypothetical protein RASY3_06680 [Ruminococcus albus SY3]|uniref:Uncharacterized protein n=1 Tax=Ruminococcus albus SY3 TaxID=1341156 RepID=A0A011UHK0_RUMAL|nr:hypothetical protein RASY3_06680 [Ruminococcus albus SY3]
MYTSKREKQQYFQNGILLIIYIRKIKICYVIMFDFYNECEVEKMGSILLIRNNYPEIHDE